MRVSHKAHGKVVGAFWSRPTPADGMRLTARESLAGGGVRPTQPGGRASRRGVTVHSLLDPAIARQQIERLTTTMQYITSVRDNSELAFDQKKADLVALSDVRLKLETIDYLLALSESRWQIVQAEALRVLEQVMRRSIPEDALDSVQNGVPALVSLTLNEQQSGLVSELANAFVIPNSFYRDELTQAAKQAARDAVRPVVQAYKTGETIVPAGEIVTPADMEAFQELGMIRPGQRWEDMIDAASLILLSAILVPLYFFRRKRASVVNEARNLAVIAVGFVVFLIVSHLFTNRTLAPYGYPL